MCEECAPSMPVARLLGRSGFGDFFGRFDDTASDNIQEVISLGSSLTWNYSAVCVGRMSLNMFVRDLSERFKYLESKSSMMFSVSLICWV